MISSLFADKVSSVGIEIVVVMVGPVLVPSRVGQQNAVLQVEEIRQRFDKKTFHTDSRFASRHKDKFLYPLCLSDIDLEVRVS